jgi:heat shock protein HtpX
MRHPGLIDSMSAAEIDASTWQHHRWLNRLQSAALLLFMGAFLALLGWLLWGGSGVLMLLFAGLTGVVLNPALSPRWVMRLYGARRLTPDLAPALWRVLGLLAERAGLQQVPALHYVPSRVLNAFAVGSPHQSAIAVTDGLLRRLSDRELLGVLAHEMSHIRNNDLWVMGLADIFSRMTSLLSLFGQILLILNLPLVLIGAGAFNWWAIALLILAPNLSALAQLALSRTREYDADLNAVALTGDPEGLASALARIERVQGGWMERILLPGRRVPEPSLLRTHPRTDDRIRRLLELRPAAPRLAQRLDGFGGPAVDLHGRPVTRSPRWHVTGLWH